MSSMVEDSMVAISLKLLEYVFLGALLVSMSYGLKQLKKKGLPSEYQVASLVVLFGVTIFGISYVLSVLFYGDPTADETGLFVNAMLGSAASMVALSAMSKKE